MLPWQQRPPELANLFNPAFCALVLHHAVAGFEEKAGKGMDFGLTFLVLPLVLQRATREALPKSTTAKFHAWIQDHEEVRVGLVKRMTTMVPLAKESMLFAMQHQALALGDNGLLLALPIKLTGFTPPSPSDTLECLKRATFLGRWFGINGNAGAILAAWGIQLT